ncbi:hypothetical protein LguiA_028005 [Lonicera macranthoides]
MELGLKRNFGILSGDRWKGDAFLAIFTVHSSLESNLSCMLAINTTFRSIVQTDLDGRFELKSKLYFRVRLAKIEISRFKLQRTPNFRVFLAFFPKK